MYKYLVRRPTYTTTGSRLFCLAACFDLIISLVINENSSYFSSSSVVVCSDQPVETCIPPPAALEWASQINVNKPSVPFPPHYPFLHITYSLMQLFFFSILYLHCINACSIVSSTKHFWCKYLHQKCLPCSIPPIYNTSLPTHCLTD